MSKILVVYESKYGNTKRVAETIVEGMQRVEGAETALNEVKKVGRKAIWQQFREAYLREGDDAFYSAWKVNF